MGEKDDLLAAEREAWEPFHDLAHSLSPEEAAEPGYYVEGWSAKDALAHVSCWLAEAAQALCQMRMGTYAAWEGDEEEVNRRFLETCRGLDHDSVLVQLHASRWRMLEELDALPEDRIDEEARTWFRESGAEHYGDHLPRLREWVEELRAGA